MAQYYLRCKGNLGRDFEVKTSKEGKAYGECTLAENNNDVTSWYKVLFYLPQDQLESCAETFKKGKFVDVLGLYREFKEVESKDGKITEQRTIVVSAKPSSIRLIEKSLIEEDVESQVSDAEFAKAVSEEKKLQAKEA